MNTQCESNPAVPLTLGAAKKIWSRERIGQFAFPQPPRSHLRLIKRPSAEARLQNATTPGLPSMRDMTAIPEGKRPLPRLRAAGRPVNPLTVYPPDGRWNFSDTTYPWRVCGRVVTAVGHGAGALVGPRHLLTASHVVDWTEVNGQIGWLRFEPDYNNGDVFPPSYAITTYNYEKISSPQGEYDVAEDYVVCVLDRPVGSELGWLGTKTYDDSWDGDNYWAHVGYPDDVGGGSRPAFEGPFSIANSWHPGYFETGHGLDMETFASLNHGDSGGPVFGWWPDGPHIVGVISGEGTLDPVVTDWSSRSANWAAGGSPMPDLVNQARSDYP